MKSSKSSLGPSAQKIIARIQKVRKAADKAARSKHRFAAYRYLRAVLRAYISISEEDLLDHLAAIAPSTLMTPVRADWHPIRLIIEATCIQPDLRMRSRWTRALEYAVADKIDPKELPRFIRAHGGIAGCADLARKIKARQKRPPLGKPSTYCPSHDSSPAKCIIATALNSSFSNSKSGSFKVPKRSESRFLIRS